MENEQLDFKFEYTNEFNQTTKFEQTINTELLQDTTELDIIMEEFKCFLLAVGFSPELVQQIQVVEEKNEI